jgi:hypothetical protein
VLRSSSKSLWRLALALLVGVAVSACIIVERFDDLAPDPTGDGGMSVDAKAEGSACPTMPCTDAAGDAGRSDAADARAPGEFRWVTTFATEGPTNAAPPYGDVRATDGGGVAVVTSFKGTLGLDGGGASAGGYDVAIAQLDRDGQVMWSRTFGGAGDDIVEAFTVDETGALWITGSSTSDPPLFSTTPNPSGLQLPFAAKLDPTGANPVPVAFDLGQVTGGTCGAVAAGPSGRVVVSCDFAGTIGLDGASGPWMEPSTGGSTDSVVMAFESGTVTNTWHRVYGGSATDRIEDLTIGTNGDAYLAGTFDSPSLSPTSIAKVGSNTNAFVIAVPRDGTTERWSWGYGQTAGGRTRALAVAADRPSGVIVGGDVNGVLNTSLLTLTTTTEEAFAMLLEPDAGTGLAVVGVGATTSTTRGIVVDPLGERTFVGEMVAVPNAKPEIGNTAVPPFGGGTGGFMVKNVGMNIVWVKVIRSDAMVGSTAGAASVYPRRVTVGDGREITVVGHFIGTTDFGDGVLRSAGPLGSTFVLRLYP